MGAHDYYDPARYYLESYHGSYPSSTRTLYYTRHLLQKAMSVIKFRIPKHWDMNYFLYTLFVNGKICITDAFGMKYGVIPQHCTVNGYNIYYNPASCIISNPYLTPNTKEIELGVTGELVRLTPDLLGIMDCVNEHAELMANASAALNMNLYNSRLSYLFWAKNAAQSESFKKMYDEIGAGNPAVVLDKNLAKLDADGNAVQPFEPFNSKLKENYISDMVLDDIVKIEQMFARKVGLPTANTLKRERMTTDETNKGDIDTRSNVALWIETLNLDFERVNNMYEGLDLGCELRFEEVGVTPKEVDPNVP